MNKIKQNKITFSLILIAIVITFSSLSILSLPVLLNYKNKVDKIENNFYKNFKIYLNSSGDISYKPFPKPHLLVENASLGLTNLSENDYLINTSNLKIYISLRDIYLRSFKNFISTEISNTNLEFELADLKKIRKHLYEKVNKPVIFSNCKIFLTNKNKEVILISPVNRILYKINNKSRIKNLFINGKIFGLNFKSEWKRSYDNPKIGLQNIIFYNPLIEIKNKFEFENIKKFNGQIEMEFNQDQFKYNIKFNDGDINIISPKNKNLNYLIDSNISLAPFYFEGSLTIKNKKIEKIIDNILSNLFIYNQTYLGNLNGLFKIKLENINNKLIKDGYLDFKINEKKINLKKANFNLKKIGNLVTEIDFVENNGIIKFHSKNELNIKNHIEFAKVFQVGSKKVKNIEKIYFDLEKNLGETDYVITNVKINNIENKEKMKEIFLIKNVQNLRANIRKVID